MCTYIGVPFRSGCNREGAQLAPAILCEALELDSVQIKFLHFASEIQPLSDEQYQGIKNYDTVLAMVLRLRDSVVEGLKTKKKVVTLGGDHSLALGSVAGSLLHDNNVGVIWFDAHGDINTEATSPSANAHGMPVAALMGLCSTALNEIAPIRLKPQNIFWVGARDLDTGEVDIINRLGISDNVYSSQKIHQLGMTAVMQEITNKMRERKITNLHLSFDIDGMDPSIVTATGTKVPNGLTQEDFEQFAQGIRDSTISLMAMDFVEYNPLLDDAQQTTGKWCKDTLQRLIDIA